jgi:hypothetical protein
MSKGGGTTIPSDYVFKIGSDGSTIHLDSDLDNIHIKEIAPVTLNSNLAVTQPIVTVATNTSDSTSKADVTIEPLKMDLTIEPLKVDSDSRSLIDLKPIAVDSCQTIKIAPLPPIRMEQPYSQHFGFTFMGMELFGFTTSGRYDTLLSSPGKGGSCNCRTRDERGHACEAEPMASATPKRGGLRVRVN